MCKTNGEDQVALYVSVFKIVNYNGTDQFTEDVICWLEHRLGAANKQWSYKKAYYCGHAAAMISFNKESHRTLFQLAWSDNIHEFYSCLAHAFHNWL